MHQNPGANNDHGLSLRRVIMSFQFHGHSTYNQAKTGKMHPNPTIICPKKMILRSKKVNNSKKLKELVAIQAEGSGTRDKPAIG